MFSTKWGSKATAQSDLVFIYLSVRNYSAVATAVTLKQRPHSLHLWGMNIVTSHEEYSQENNTFCFSHTCRDHPRQGNKVPGACLLGAREDPAEPPSVLCGRSFPLLLQACSAENSRLTWPSPSMRWPACMWLQINHAHSPQKNSCHLPRTLTRKTTGGPPIKAMAVESFRLLPPL